MKVTPLERDVYLVESQGTGSEGVKEYRVDLSKEDFGCACESYQFNYEYMNHTHGLRQPCKHILAAQRYIESVASGKISDKPLRMSTTTEWNQLCEEMEKSLPPLKEFLDGWGPHCGASRSTFRGHLCKTLLEICKLDK